MTMISQLSSAPNTIMLKVNSIGEKYGEGKVKTGKTIYPGDLIDPTTDTTYPDCTYQPFATAAGLCDRIVAIELALAADVFGAATTKGGTIDDAYAAGDTVRFHECMPGDIMYMWVAASASAIAQNAYLEADGAGGLRVYNAGVRLFRAMEAVDNHLNGASRARIRARAVI